VPLQYGSPARIIGKAQHTTSRIEYLTYPLLRVLLLARDVRTEHFYCWFHWPTGVAVD
jgi:hypothetical protein